jgi:hypothetical protein
MIAALAVSLLAGGCTTAAPRIAGDAAEPIEITPEEQPVEYMRLPAARIFRVNTEEGFAILKCTVLPMAGEEATVFRGDRTVASLRISRGHRGPFAVADIIDGDVQRNDLVVYRCPVTRKLEEAAP